MRRNCLIWVFIKKTKCFCGSNPVFSFSWKKLKRKSAHDIKKERWDRETKGLKGEEEWEKD